MPHSPEPWEARRSLVTEWRHLPAELGEDAWHALASGVLAPEWLVWSGSRIVAICSPLHGDAEANARRIVACVNAARGPSPGPHTNGRGHP